MQSPIKVDFDNTNGVSAYNLCFLFVNIQIKTQVLLYLKISKTISMKSAVTT